MKRAMMLLGALGLVGCLGSPPERAFRCDHACWVPVPGTDSGGLLSAWGERIEAPDRESAEAFVLGVALAGCGSNATCHAECRE